MVKVTAVIGANFGDEGKGRVVDELCRKNASDNYVVVRYNGGAQAGHTVQTKTLRHVFHHYGAGTIAGNETYLAFQFIANPLLWRMEYEELQSLGVELKGKLFINKKCRITTPWDMLINQALERKRGGQRHGSCGVGIFETVNRSQFADFIMSDLLTHPTAMHYRLEAVKNYALHRAFGLDIVDTEFLNVFHSNEMEIDFIDACTKMAILVPVPGDYDWSVRNRNLLFEGAQGLGLDQDNKKFYPYLTPSSTGLPYIIEMLRDQVIIQKLEAINVTYVTRPYLTRHGAGALPNEDPTMSFSDLTNNPNEFQGSLRFAPLDLDMMFNNIVNDMDRAFGIYPSLIVPSMAVTCWDQIGDGIPFYHGGKRCFGAHNLLSRIERRFNPTVLYEFE